MPRRLCWLLVSRWKPDAGTGNRQLRPQPAKPRSEERPHRPTRHADELLTTVTEQTVREQNGDPRYLNIAWRVAEREDRLGMPPSGTARPTDQVEEVVGRRRRRQSDGGATRLADVDQLLFGHKIIDG
ncbi:MAG TPA: hypothetical protein VFW87_22820 [Pirellulales bacterium]|nr:hypothetical protein [Pirellulales bacterium]